MLIIKEEKMDKFLEKLKEEFDFFDAKSDSPAGGMSFKRYFLPPAEEIFVRHVKPNKSTSGAVTVRAPKKFIVFGLNLPDLEALTYLDEIMRNPNEDFFYLQKRNQAIVIGLIKEKIDASPGGDIVFQDVGKAEYRIWQNTAKGKNLIKKYKEFFEESTTVVDSGEAPQIPDNESLGKWPRSMRELLLDPELLAKAVEWSRDHPIWDELGEKCLGCGICTYVCPLCHCFSIEDSVGLDDNCKRCRKWDACTLPEFAKIAGGHNFRPTIKARYYNWFYHKFVRGYNEFGRSQCVGCGRCKKFCPASIDIKEILETILEDYKKQNG